MDDDQKGPKPKGAKGEYEVGYGKPPKETRWKKGQSGNTSGRPLKSKNQKSIYQRTMAKQVSVKQNGRRVWKSVREVAFEQIANKILRGEGSRACRVPEARNPLRKPEGRGQPRPAIHGGVVSVQPQLVSAGRRAPYPTPGLGHEDFPLSQGG